jgi:endonuclease YncB( thermonuclease family)
VALLLAASPIAAQAASARARRASERSRVVLDGVPTAVRWTDGDTFRILEGAGTGRSARLAGTNALESYGPVHRWGDWRPAELLANARQATALARGDTWTCRTLGAVDRYRRLLVSCPDAARALVSRGLSMVMAVGAEAPDPALVAAQQAAQAGRAGMWARGVPPLLPTSVHAAGEPDAGPEGAYDRVVDTATGRSAVRRHQNAYRTCQEVCVGEGAGQACMVYVPYERRYRNRPACLRIGRSASR